MSRAATVLVVWCCATAALVGQTLTSVMTSPVDGANGVPVCRPAEWTAVPGVTVYYLYVGSTPGAKDLINSGETTSTSYKLGALPVGQTVYARLWTKLAGVWRYTDSTFTASSCTATLTYPADGSSTVDVAQSIRWSAVPGAQTYYLYVGSTVGAKDLIDTGETLNTSYPASRLPGGQTVYARLWTKFDNVWRYEDCSFTTPALIPSFVDPSPGSTISPDRAWNWTAVPDVQTYYLYVGSTVGAKDLVNTGEIPATTYTPRHLPVGTVYARLWSKVSSVWRYRDAAFTVPETTAEMTWPPDQAEDVDLTQPIRWTSVPNRQVYYLYLGSTPGAKDLVNTGEITQTSYFAYGLPAHQTIYARLWTKFDNVWRYRDTTFTAAPLTASLTYPADGAVSVDRARPATWTTVAGADAYRLLVGSAPGASDFLDSGSIDQTTTPLDGVPAAQLVYARLLTRAAGGWRYTDTTFSAAPPAAEFLYPLDGATGVDTLQPFRWTTAVGAEGYRVTVGSAPGDGDLADSGEVSGTSWLAAGLPATGTLYARVWTKVGGAWTRHSDIAFTPESAVQPSHVLIPVDGTTQFDAAQPIQWEDVALARGYRLTIGTAAGASDVHDSGEIHVTRRFVTGLPTGVPLFGRLQTLVDGQWQATDFSFEASSSATNEALQVKSALWATDQVRRMAADDDRPFGGTLLWNALGPRYAARDADFAAALLLTLDEANVGLAARRLDVAFNSTGADGHALVELSTAGGWMLLDPAFDLSVATPGGAWATAEDVSAATQALDWAGVSYRFLGAAADAYVSASVVDYPLLFVDVVHQGATLAAGAGPAPFPYLQAVSLPVAGTPASYVVGCGGGSAALEIDGVATELACPGAGGTSAVFQAASVAVPGGGTPTFTLYQLRRFVF